MTIKEIIASIKEKKPEIKSLLFVGCGASMSELFPGKYFMDRNAKTLRSSIHTANELNYSTPACCDETCIVIACSLSGTTPETVSAAKKATELGASVVGVTIDPESPLAKATEYQIIHGFHANYAAKVEKMGNVIAFACEVLNEFEGYDDYDAMQDGFAKIYDLIENAISYLTPAAEEFAEKYKDAPHIYVLGSGAAQMSAYSFSMFLLMEMQWIPSSSFNAGEFFHGPFELVDKDVPYLLLMNDGPTRPMDQRALTFLQRFDAMTTIVDAKDFGLSASIAKSVVEFFNPMLITGVLRIYAEKLAIARNHPLTKRRYMWKLEY